MAPTPLSVPLSAPVFPSLPSSAPLCFGNCSLLSSFRFKDGQVIHHTPLLSFYKIVLKLPSLNVPGFPTGSLTDRVVESSTASWVVMLKTWSLDIIFARTQPTSPSPVYKDALEFLQLGIVAGGGGRISIMVPGKRMPFSSFILMNTFFTDGVGDDILPLRRDSQTQTSFSKIL